jgi:predicted O-methyltransferase YrrM
VENVRDRINARARAATRRRETSAPANERCEFRAPLSRASIALDANDADACALSIVARAANPRLVAGRNNGVVALVVALDAIEDDAALSLEIARARCARARRVAPLDDIVRRSRCDDRTRARRAATTSYG